MHTIKMILFIILLIADLYLLSQTGKKKVINENVNTIKKWTVYGTMTCEWTRKQLEYLNKTKRHYLFINCNEESCEDIAGFPYMIHPNGETSIGYTEF
jgi:hypothetical protein